MLIKVTTERKAVAGIELVVIFTVAAFDLSVNPRTNLVVNSGSLSA